MVHPTSYDGALELACLQLDLPCFSCTSVDVCFKAAKECVKDFLLKALCVFRVTFNCQAWKEGQFPMDKVLPRYKAKAPTEELPSKIEPPQLALCQCVDGRLSLPRDVRQQFLQCPIWGPEWRIILTEFDREWSASTPTSTTGADGGKDVVPIPAPHVPSSADPCIPNEPGTVEQVKAKYGDVVAELPMPNTSVTLALFAGPVLFVVAKEACSLHAADGPIVTHGAGSWLQAEKAQKYEEKHPGHGIPRAFHGDLCRVVLEDRFII